MTAHRSVKETIKSLNEDKPFKQVYSSETACSDYHLFQYMIYGQTIRHANDTIQYLIVLQHCYNTSFRYFM